MVHGHIKCNDPLTSSLETSQPYNECNLKYWALIDLETQDVLQFEMVITHTLISVNHDRWFKVDLYAMKSHQMVCGGDNIQS